MSASMKMPSDRHSWLATVLTGVTAVLLAFPFAWMFFSSFKTTQDVFDPRLLLPKRWDFTYYKQLLGGGTNVWEVDFFAVFANSIAIAGVQAAGAVAVTAMAGYVFARHKFRGRNLLFLLAIAVIVLPRQMMALPLFEWLNTLGLIGSRWGVILPGMVSGIGIVFFTQVFRRVPDELLDAARVEGASEFRVFLTLLPLVRGSVIAYALIHFILAWHEHLIPLLVLSTETRTLNLALSSLYGSSLHVPYAVFMAGSVIAALPAVVLFAVFYRQLKTAMSELLLA
jgi:ABC-type glycerol-3-phosphate transport system permease component